ncbi:PD-(D/E)XK nuclease family protein [Winogradskyella sp. PAMC22761]|nr:PD-(D/E)XK nuclease family protein [Winogradskyella sp. PAMC22761]
MTKQTEAILYTSKVLLGNVKRILKHQEEIKKLKGENFNVFSILKMESKENGTHSAFLGELLNPKGSHNFKSVFLGLFLQQLGCKGLDLNSAEVVLEYSLGFINDKAKTGGRVDIYIKDATNKTICIENKIYATDQNLQIKRYSNHNKGNNTVYYLTLTGEEPADWSKDDLAINEDYHCISYRKIIIEWLELCLKEAADQPILRESIKQYIILLKKLTNQLSDDKMEKEIKDIIKSNYKSAKTISDNIEVVEVEYASLYLNEIGEMVINELNETESIWTFEVDNDLTRAWSALDIHNAKWPSEIVVELQGNSKIYSSQNDYGLIAHRDCFNRESICEKLEKNGFSQSEWTSNATWVCYNNIMNLGDIDERANLFNDKTRAKLVEQVATRIIELCRLCDLPLRNFPKIETT